MKVRTSTLGDVGNIEASPGTKDWSLAVHNDLMRSLNDMAGDARHARAMKELLLQHDGWKQLTDRKGRRFLSFTHYCTTDQPFGLGYDPDFLSRMFGEAIEALEAEGNTQPTVGETKNRVQEIAEDAKPTLSGDELREARAEGGKKGGRPKVEEKDGEQENLDYDITKVSRLRGTDPSYLASRIARDRPDIHEKMKAGEYRSVRSAAVEAGIIKPELRAPDDPAKLAAYLLKKWDRDRIADLLRALADAMTETETA